MPWKRKRERKRDDRYRGPAHLRGYDHDWGVVRNAHIEEFPFCQDCEQRGILVYENLIVDHQIPIKIRPDLRLDRKNCRTLCRPCHTLKTNADLQRYGVT